MSVHDCWEDSSKETPPNTMQSSILSKSVFQSQYFLAQKCPQACRNSAHILIHLPEEENFRSDLYVHLEGCDVLLITGHLEVHVTQCILAAKDVCQDLVPAILRQDKTHGHTRDLPLQWNSCNGNVRVLLLGIRGSGRAVKEWTAQIIVHVLVSQNLNSLFCQDGKTRQCMT